MAANGIRRFSGDESFIHDPNAYNDKLNTAGMDEKDKASRL